MDMAIKVKRLFEQFRPGNYVLELDVDRDSMSFRGSVAIGGRKVGRPSKRLTLHQKDLKITTARLTSNAKGGPREIPVSRINIHKSSDEVRLHSDEIIYPGEFELHIEFSGNITEAMHGMYPCFFEYDGKKKSLIATQFESHHAREVFPCIDEPEAKAIFDLTLHTPIGETVLGNTPIKKRSEIKSKQKTVFETSPLMSPYLLAFVFGEMHAVEAKAKDGTIVSSWATVAQPKSFLEYANSEAVKILEFFTDYFQTPFPLKKLDQVALPDFEVGAMENWGLITYRQVALLADPDNRSQSSEQYISMVVAHEISHQWFGNLVTMKWWDDLWLNESFASLMEHIALDVLHPDWFQWEQYAVQDVIASSNRDIYKDVQPVRVDVNHPDEIATLFDGAIVYAKGGRLLKMLLDYIGEESFRAGLKSYFKKHAYNNTVRDDLWLELSKSSNKDVNALMDPWLEQSGMPQLDINRTAKDLNISQKRFILDSDNDSRMWPIPLLADQKLTADLLYKRSASISMSGSKPVIFNVNGSTHMVVKYADEPSREYIEQALVKRLIPPQSRINILNDYILLARAGELSILEALEIIEKAGSEPREAVWQQIARVIGTLGNLTEGDEDMEAELKNLRRSISESWYEKLGWDDASSDDPNTKALRQTMLSLQVLGESKDALKEAKKRYSQAKRVEDLPSEQRALISGAMVRANFPGVVDALLKEHQSTQNSDLQSSIAAALASTKDTETATRIIEKSLGKDGFVRPQDIFRWYAYFMRNRHTRPEAWKWLTANWERLEKIFSSGKSFDHLISYSAAYINTEDWQQKFEVFFKPKRKKIYLERDINIALSEIPARIVWRKREEPKIQAYFKKRN